MATTTHDEEELIERTSRAHLRWCERNGALSDELGFGQVDGDVVTLGNVRGVLARYRVAPSGRLARLPYRE